MIDILIELVSQKAEAPLNLKNSYTMNKNKEPKRLRNV